MEGARRVVDRLSAMAAAGTGEATTLEQKFNLLPIKWMYATDNLSGEGRSARAVPQDGDPSILDRAVAAANSAAKAVAHRNPARHKNVYDLPEALEKEIYLVFTHLTTRHFVGIYVTKTQAIQIVNWLINYLNGGESGDELPLPAAGRGGGKRRKRKSHRRKSHRRKTHKRKSHKRKRTRRRH